MQFRSWESTWRNHRMPWLLLIMLVILVVIALWVFLDYQRAVSAMTIKADYDVTRLTAVRIREELAGFSDELVALARASGIVSGDPEQQAEALRKAAPIREGLFDAGIVVLNNFGSVTASEPPRPQILQQDWSDRPYFRELLSPSSPNAVFSNAIADGPAGAQVIVVSVPVLDGEGRFMGALAGMLRLSQSTISPYYATLVKLRVSPDGTAYLIDRSRKILFDSASLLNGQQYTNHPLPNAGEPGAGEALRTRDTTGREMLVSYAPIPGTPWTLVIEKSWEGLLAPTKTQANLLFALLGLGAVLSLASLALLVRQQSSPAGWDDSIARDSHLAHQIDHALLPDRPPILPGWEIAVHREPGLIAGRVFYDVMLGLDGCVTLAIAETASRNRHGSDGVSAVLSMLQVRTLLRSAARDLLAPAEALAHTNRLLCPDMPPGDFVACLYCRLDPGSGAIRIGNADHMRPLRVTGSSVDIIGSQDPPLALHLECRYGESAITLAGGDAMLFYSSRVLDVRNAEGEPFGFARLEKALSAPGKEGVQRADTVADAIREFAGGNWADDRDAILIVLERVRAGAISSQSQEA